MSDIQRYSVTHNVVDEEDCGEWVLYDDHIAVCEAKQNLVNMALEDKARFADECIKLQARNDELENQLDIRDAGIPAYKNIKRIKAEGIEEFMEEMTWEFKMTLQGIIVIEASEAHEYIAKLRGEE